MKESWEGLNAQALVFKTDHKQTFSISVMIIYIINDIREFLKVRFKSFSYIHFLPKIKAYKYEEKAVSLKYEFSINFYTHTNPHRHKL